MTDEQRRKAWLSEQVVGLWARWYASGPDDLSRGWDRPAGPWAGRFVITRADVRDLAECIRTEHGDDPQPLG